MRGRAALLQLALEGVGEEPHHAIVEVLRFHLVEAGLVGVGSFNDAAAFDDLTVLPIASPSRPVITPVQRPVLASSTLASAPKSLFN